MGDGHVFGISGLVNTATVCDIEHDEHGHC